MTTALRVMVIMGALGLAHTAAFAQSLHPLDIARHVDPLAKETMEAGAIPSITIAIVEGEDIVWSGAYGYANLWAKTPATVDTVYLIGSTFKAMATVALLQQMEAGKFALDDPVSDHLDPLRIKNEKADQPVTFRHLLTHTSGLPGDFGPHPVWGDTRPAPLKDYLANALVVERPPLEEYVYSNIAYTLIGHLMERFTGNAFRTYIDQNVFQPLDMKDTAFHPRPDMDERLAIPYTYSTSTGKHAPAIRLNANVWPAGIVYGAVLDQGRWLAANLNGGAYRDHRLIAETTHDKMLEPQYKDFKGRIQQFWLPDESNIGLTWWVAKRDGDRFFAHSGSVPGYTAFLAGNRDRRIGVAMLSNGNQSHTHLAKLGMNIIAFMEREQFVKLLAR